MDFEERVVDRRPVFHGHLIDVEVQTVQTPAGRTASREVVHHAPAVAILALTNDHKMILERQWRAPIAATTLEIPAGKVDARDDGALEHAAIRELNEETRMQAGRLVKVNESYSSVGFADEKIVLFLATDLTPVDRALPQDRDERLALSYVSRAEALKMVQNGQIQDMKTVMAIYYWQTLPEEA